MKSILKSKVFWTGLGTVFTGIGLYFSGEQNLQELIISIIGVVFVILRLYTNKSVYIK